MMSPRHSRWFILLLLGAAAMHARAQGSAGTGAKFEPRAIVDMPSAGMLPKGGFALDLQFYQEGGVLIGCSTGIFDRLTLGVSYGGSHLIGPDAPVMNPLPGLHLKVRLLNESLMLPALALGFDSQGKEGYLKGLDRYLVKSPGLYAVASKNYTMLGFLSLHGGVNYSLEGGDGDTDVNLFAGAEKTLGPFLSLMAEYNAGINDNNGKAVGTGRGYLNAAINIALGEGFTLGVNFKDLFKNARDSDVVNRTIKFEYITYF